MEQFFGPYGTLSAENIPRFRDSEANAVWFHGFNPQLFERCETAGAAACVEFRTFRASFDEHPELRPIGVDGKPIRYGRLVQGICLSQTEFIEERTAELRQGLADFRPTGVWLDYLTYAGWFETPEPDLQESCFCAQCVEEFNRSCGTSCDDPREILDRYADVWHQHKVDRIAEFGRQFAAIVKSAQPNTILGVYACPWYPEEFGGAIRTIFGQDVARLSEIFDVITPLIYAEKCGKRPEWSAEYMERSREFVPASAAVVPILDVLDFPTSLTALADSASRDETSRPPGGVQIFGGDAIFGDPEKARLFDESIERIRAVSAGRGR